MSSDAFSGSTLKFEDADPPTTVVGDISDIEFSENGNPIDVTDAANTFHVFLAGVGSMEMSVTVFGIPTQVIGDEGQILIAWNDGTTDGTSDEHFIITGKARSGNVGGAITTRLTFALSKEAPSP